MSIDQSEEAVPSFQVTRVCDKLTKTNHRTATVSTPCRMSPPLLAQPFQLPRSVYDRASSQVWGSRKERYSDCARDQLFWLRALTVEVRQPFIKKETKNKKQKPRGKPSKCS